MFCNAAVRAAGVLGVHSNPGGQAAGMLHAVCPAAAIFADLVTGAIAALAAVNDKVTVG